MVHLALGYEATLIIGHVGAIGAILGGFWRLSWRLGKLTVEHEMLVNFMCKQMGISREDLPTRTHGIF